MPSGRGGGRGIYYKHKPGRREDIDKALKVRQEPLKCHPLTNRAEPELTRNHSSPRPVYRLCEPM